MRVNDLKRPQLSEGFIDNFIAKVQNMAGDDGATGVLRALRGQNAALNKFADVIANETTPKVSERLGNQAQGIDAGSAPTPVGMILKQAELIGSLLAKKENIIVTPTEIQSVIATNKDDILKMLLVGDTSDDTIVKSLFNAVVLRSPNVRLRNSLSASIRTIALIVAGTIIYIKTTKEDQEDFTIDPTDLQNFNSASEQVDEVLFDPTSPEIRALGPNEDFKDHMHWLIIQMISAIKKKYAVLDNARLTTLLATPPALVTPLELKSALSGHSASVDQATVAQVMQKATLAIQNQFKAWLEIAVKETAAGGPPNESEHLYIDPWGTHAMQLVDNMKFAPAATATTSPTKQAGKPIPTAGKPEAVTIGGQEIKPNDPLYDKIMATVHGTENENI